MPPNSQHDASSTRPLPGLPSASDWPALGLCTAAGASSARPALPERARPLHSRLRVATYPLHHPVCRRLPALLSPRPCARSLCRSSQKHADDLARLEAERSAKAAADQRCAIEAARRQAAEARAASLESDLALCRRRVEASAAELSVARCAPSLLSRRCGPNVPGHGRHRLAPPPLPAAAALCLPPTPPPSPRPPSPCVPPGAGGSWHMLARPSTQTGSSARPRATAASPPSSASARAERPARKVARTSLRGSARQPTWWQRRVRVRVRPRRRRLRR